MRGQRAPGAGGCGAYRAPVGLDGQRSAPFIAVVIAPVDGRVRAI